MPPPNRRTTLRDVARAAHVSVSAASMALNGKPGISDRTRALVWQTANELQYVPDRRARELRLGRQGEVVLAVSPTLTQDVGTVSRLFALRLLTTLTDELRDRDLRPLPLQPDGDYSRSAALIVIGDHEWAHPWPDVPIIAAGAEVAESRVAATLTHDHRGYLTEVLDHLTDQGATHVALLREPTSGNYQDVVNRFLARAATHRDLRLTVFPTRIRESHSRAAAQDARRQGADAILSLLPFPGAILAGLADAGARVPDDVLLVVRGEGLIESQTSPPVSALSMCGEACARVIAQTLDAVLTGERDLHVTLPHNLMVRTSSRRDSVSFERT